MEFAMLLASLSSEAEQLLGLESEAVTSQLDAPGAIAVRRGSMPRISGVEGRLRGGVGTR